MPNFVSPKTFARIFSLGYLLIAQTAFGAPATLDEYWNGKAHFVLRHRVDLSTISPESGPNDNKSMNMGADVVVRDGVWYLFNREYYHDYGVTAPSYCRGGDYARIVVRKSLDKGATWSAATPIIEPPPRPSWSTVAVFPNECANVDGDAFFDTDTNKWHYLFQCHSGGAWDMCHAESTQLDPTQGGFDGTVQRATANGSLWSRMLPFSGVFDEGTPEIVEKVDGWFYVTFHGQAGRWPNGRYSLQRGVARTRDFFAWDTSFLPGTIYNENDCARIGGQPSRFEGLPALQGYCMGGGAATILKDGGYYYQAIESNDVADQAHQIDSNWFWVVLRSPILSNPTWEVMPGRHGTITSDAPEGFFAAPTGTAWGMDGAGYARFFRDTDGTVYYLIFKQGNHPDTSSDPKTAYYLYELVKDTRVAHFQFREGPNHSFTHSEVMDNQGDLPHAVTGNVSWLWQSELDHYILRLAGPTAGVTAPPLDRYAPAGNLALTVRLAQVAWADTPAFVAGKPGSYWMQVDRSNFCFYVQTDLETKSVCGLPPLISPKTVQGVFDAPELKLYIDGTLVSSTVIRGFTAANASARFKIGEPDTGTGFTPFDGYIYDVALDQLPQTLKPPVPLSPTGLLAPTFPKTTQVTLNWTPIPGVTRYALRVNDETTPAVRDPRNTCVDSPHYLCLNVDGTSLTLPVVEGHRYTWWIHSFTPDLASLGEANYAGFVMGHNDAAVAAAAIPDAVETGKTFNVTVTMKNTGNTTWKEAAFYRLGNDVERLTPVWGGVSRVLIPSADAVDPGSEKTFDFELTAPAAPGTYSLRGIGMLQEGVEWFGESVPARDIQVLGRVATPVLSPVGGTFGDQAIITMTVATSDAEIQYRNPADLVKTWTTYTGPVILTASQSLEARAVKAGMITSDTAASQPYEILAKPQVTVPATLLRVTAGDQALFQANATGAAPLDYQWYRGAAAIAGATGPQYLLPSTSLQDSGAVFMVRVSNAVGFVNSPGITLQVDPVPPTNVPPAVNAGADQSITLPADASLSGSVTDDGLPKPPRLDLYWSQVSGPGVASIADPTSAVTRVAFSQAGSYVLRLTATDGQLSAQDEVAIQVQPSPPVNQPPAVDAGADQQVDFGTTALLNGLVSDDGLPAPARLTLRWSQVSGPGVVAFSAPASQSTSVTFSKPGTFVLRLTAEDSALTSSDLVTVVVKPVEPTNETLPAPQLLLPSPVLSLQSQIGVSYPALASLSGFDWSFVPKDGSAGSMGLAATLATPVSFRTNGRTADLAIQSLQTGTYHLSVVAVFSDGRRSPAAEADVTLAGTSLADIQVYPSPWKGSRHGAVPVRFAGLPAGSHVRLFTVDGRRVRDLGHADGSLAWDLKDDEGRLVPSGLYLYVIDGAAGRHRGKLAVVR